MFKSLELERKNKDTQTQAGGKVIATKTWRRGALVFCQPKGKLTEGSSERENIDVPCC